MNEISQLDEQGLKNAKLRAEIRDLKRPNWVQPSFWFSWIGITVAIVTTTFAIRQESRLKELARIELRGAEKEANRSIKLAEQQAQEAEAKVTLLKEKMARMNDATGEFRMRFDNFSEEKLDVANAEVEELTNQLQPIKDRLAALGEVKEELDKIAALLPVDKRKAFSSASRDLGEFLKVANGQGEAPETSKH